MSSLLPKSRDHFQIQRTPPTKQKRKINSKVTWTQEGTCIRRRSLAVTTTSQLSQYRLTQTVTALRKPQHTMTGSPSWEISRSRAALSQTILHRSPWPTEKSSKSLLKMTLWRSRPRSIRLLSCNSRRIWRTETMKCQKSRQSSKLKLTSQACRGASRARCVIDSPSRAGISQHPIFRQNHLSSSQMEWWSLADRILHFLMCYSGRSNRHLEKPLNLILNSSSSDRTQVRKERWRRVSADRAASYSTAFFMDNQKWSNRRKISNCSTRASRSQWATNTREKTHCQNKRGCCFPRRWHWTRWRKTQTTSSVNVQTPLKNRLTRRIWTPSQRQGNRVAGMASRSPRSTSTQTMMFIYRSLMRRKTRL